MYLKNSSIGGERTRMIFLKCDRTVVFEVVVKCFNSNIHAQETWGNCRLGQLFCVELNWLLCHTND